METKEKLNGKKTEVKEDVQICLEQVNELLKKYKCKLIVQPSDYFGQRVFVPVIVPDDK